jgi:hypothetical protein
MGDYHPRFLCGRETIAALVRGMTWAARNSSPASTPFAALVTASSFDSLKILSAAFALLLGRFFGFGMVPPLLLTFRITER